MDEMTTHGVVSVSVEVRSGLAAGRRFTVHDFPCVMGRSREVDLCIEDDAKDPTISRKHARLCLENGHVVLEDISSNGTWVAGRLLQPQERVVLPAEPLEVSLGPRIRVSLQVQRETPTMRPSSQLSLQFLGRFSARVQTRVVPDNAWQSRKAIVLLALLAETPQTPVSVPRIEETLWPEADEASRQALQATVSRLRRSLRSAAPDLPDPIGHQGESYVLTWPTQSDVQSFEKACQEGLRRRAAGDSAAAVDLLTQAMDVYGGALLEGVEEAWVVRRRTWLTGRAEEAMLALGELTDSLHWYGRLLQTAPCHEVAHAGVLRVLVQAGRRDEARRHYEQAVVALRQHLNATPGPELQAAASLL